ncbi:MAG: PBECR4 domain-containing protein, partial [Clostridium sp.]
KISKSEFFYKDEERKIFGIEDRITYFTKFENILDSNNLVFKYNKNQHNWSLIDCEYIFENFDYDKKIYVFIDDRKTVNEKFCRSFFPKETTDYTKNQMKMSLIYKEKINLDSGDSIIQLDKRNRH